MRIKFPLYVSYDSDEGSDGYGAQALRILGIYAISNFFRLKYVHKGITNISDTLELLGAENLDTDTEVLSTVLKQLNSLINLPSDTTHRKSTIEVNIHNIGFRILFKYLLLSIVKPNKYFLKIYLPFGITDRFPNVFYSAGEDFARLVSQQNYLRNSTRVVIHLRAAEHSPDKKRPQLPPSYYRKVISDLEESLCSEFDLVIHTDFFDSDFYSGVQSERVLGFKELITELSERPRTKVFHYAPITNVLVDMVSADYLVISRSALSYFAAILNQNRVAFPSNHGHKPLSHWEVRYVD